ITPTLRGRFVAKAARIAFEEAGFVRFEMRYALTSGELVEQLSLHQLNCALINAEAIGDDRNFAVSEVFADSIALVVPSTVPVEDIRQAVLGYGEPVGPLSRYVEVDASASIKSRTEQWYRTNLPGARAMFAATTYPAAVDICAEGLATAHCPLSLVPNLPAATLKRLQFLRLPELSRSVALVMPRHLLTLAPYARIFRRIEEFCRNDYSREMEPAEVQDFATVLAVDGGAGERRALLQQRADRVGGTANNEDRQKLVGARVNSLQG
ncbi:MAG TPA: hypothetical protein GYA10_08285, partial [Alphaproteobacteria bacterium]|nr:hypothetical protein [Alphaproteobacteria bacterium]